MAPGSPSGISRRKKVLKPPQLVVTILAERELDAIAVGRRGLDQWAARRSGRNGGEQCRFSGRAHDLAADRRQRGRRRRNEGRRRKLSYRRCRVGTWRQLYDERLDFAPAPITGAREYRFVICRRERSAEHPNGSETHLARGEQIEDHGKAPARPRRHDAVARGVFGQPKNLRAIAEEGTATSSGVQGRPSVEHRQVGYELDRGVPLLGGEYADASQKIRIRQSGRESEDVRFHSFVYHGQFWRSARGSL
jgi:hypothetical protein